MAKKLKSVNASQPSSSSSSSNAFAYKNFNSTGGGGGKRRKNRKKYFEHDTRTHTIRTTKIATTAVNPNSSAMAAIKKIKFNNEIRIFETKNGNVDVTTTPTTKKKKPFKKQNTIVGQKKRDTFRMRRNANNASSTTETCIQTSTKKLQKQLIETQKKLQKQLNALQDQNHSFLALLHSNCMHTNVNAASATNARNATATTTLTSTFKHDNNNDCNNDDDGGGSSNTHIDHTHNSHVNSNAIQKLSNTTGIGYSNQNLPYSEHFYKFFTDQSKCSIDKMANGNKATTIRAFTCESKSKNCSVSTNPEAKIQTSSSNDLCNHQCNSCAISNAKSYISTGIGHTIANIKKPKIHIKKPLLKSIILSTNNCNNNPTLNIKQEIEDHSECDDIHITKEPLQPIIDSIGGSGECSTTKLPIATKIHSEMQYSDTKKTKQINSYFKTNDFVQQNARSYSPPLPVTHRLTSIVSNDAPLTNTITSTNNNNNNNHSRRSHTSRERKSSKRRKKRRRSYPRESRSRSRSNSRSRSSSQSRSRSTSRSHRRRSSRSRSSSFDENSRHYSQERKKKSHSKNRDVFRRSSKRDDRNCGCSCNCINYCKKSSKSHSTFKNNSKSPSNDSSKQCNTSPSDSKNSKRFNTTTSSNDANGSSTSKKKPITMSSGVLLKQQPIVKLHSSPATGSDSDNEIDDKFDRKYEELLTFETNEDERREQRLLKALSDIAAKAKQKIQSISSDSNVAKSVHADRNHNDRSTSNKSNKSFKHNSMKKSNESRDERRSERQTSEDVDYSPRERERKHTKRGSSRRSRRDSSCSSSSSSKEEKSTRSSRSPSIPRRRGSPSFLDRRRITSARKKPIPYQRSSPYDSYDERDSS